MNIDDSNDQEEKEFCIGTVIGFHGLDGFLKIRSDISNASILDDVETVTIRRKDKTEETATVRQIKITQSQFSLALTEFPDRTAAESLLGATLYTMRSELGNLDADEFWVRDLVGMDVYTTDGAHVGTVCDVYTGANELLEIRLAGSAEPKTALVPFVTALVPVVDLKGRRIEIEDLPGLLD